jgi:CBS domain containing-hemolysin-like protein
MPSLAEFQLLPLTQPPGHPQLPQPGQDATLTDPAISQLTDLRLAPCVTVDHHDAIAPTLHVMQRARVRMAFVTGVGGELVGLVTADGLQGEQPLLRAMADHIGVEELTLDQVMTPLAAWKVVDAWQIEHSRLGNVAATMREHGLRYLLVVQRHENTSEIRGLISAHRLEQALGIELGHGLHSRSFAEIEAALAR